MINTINSRKILLISFHFPPSAGVGGIRPAKFAKYLPQFGWHPYVLTIDEKYIASKDYTRVENNLNIPISRTSVWKTPLQVAVSLKRKMRKPEVDTTVRPGRLNICPRLHTASHYKRYLNRLRLNIIRFLDSIFELPDQDIGWVFPALWTGFWIIKKHSIKVIYSTSPPVTAALIGLILSRLTGARLILDLRDSLYLHASKPLTVRTAISDAIEKWFERKLIKRSAKVISTTENYTQFLRTQYPEVPKGKFCTIWNGFDTEDFRDLQPAPHPQCVFTLSYLGTFYYGRSPETLFQAVGELINEGALSKSGILIRLIGAVDEIDAGSIKDLVSRNGLCGCVTIEPRIPYKESLKCMLSSQVLLLFAPDQYYEIPGKTLEYLAAGRYILCFANEGATANLIRTTSSGLVVKPDDIKQIKRAVKRLFWQWKSGQTQSHNNDIKQFDRRVLTERLAEVL